MRPPPHDDRGPGPQDPGTSTTITTTSCQTSEVTGDGSGHDPDRCRTCSPGKLAKRSADLTDEQLVELFGIVRPEPSPEVLSSATIGAIRRQRGETGWCDFAKVYLATLLVQEAQRRILLERLDGIMQFLAAGADPDQAIGRLVRLVDEYHGGEIHREMAA